MLPACRVTVLLSENTWIVKKHVLTNDTCQDMNRFGGALDTAEDAGLMIIGDEFSEIDG